MNRCKTVFFILLVSNIALFGCASDEEKKASHLEKGHAYFEKGEYKSAEIELKNAVQIDPKYLAAYEKLGEVYLKLGNAQQAFKTYSRVAELDPENMNAQIKLATFYMLGKKMDESMEKIDLVLTKQPDNIDALFLQAGVFNLEKKFSEAESVFNKILVHDPNQTNAYLGLGRVLMLQGRFNAAEKKLKMAVNLDVKDIKPALTLFEFYMNRKKFVKALATVKGAIKENPTDADLYIVLGNFYYSQKKQDKAETAYLKAIETDPENVKPYMVAVGFYDATGNKKNTMEMYNRALELQKDDVRIMNAVARYHFKNGAVDDAAIHVDKMLEKRPAYFPARMLKGELYILNKQFVEAFLLFEDLAKQEPRSARAHYFKGIAHVGKNEAGLAKTSLLRAIELNPRFIKAKIVLADLYMRDKAFELARKEGAEILKFLPDNYQAKMIVGNALMYQGHSDEAASAFKDLIKLDPLNPAGYFRLGLLQRLTKQYDSALANFEKALIINPRLMDVFTNIVFLHSARKDFAVALEQCDRQARVVKDSPELLAVVYNLKGEVKLAQKKIKEAEICFQDALEQNPDFLRPYYALARIYLKDNQEDKAIAQYKALLVKNPNQVVPYMLMGTIFDMQKRFDLSEEHYRAALEINPEFAPAANNLSYLLANQDKELDQALALAQIAKEKLPDDPGVMDTLGWVLYKKGLYDSAINEFTDSLGKIADNPTIHYHLGMAYYKKQNPERAREQMEKALSLAQSFDGADEARKILSEL